MENIVYDHENINQAIKKLEELKNHKILFVIDDNSELIGSITDGDVRRGLLDGLKLNDLCIDFCNKGVRFLNERFKSEDLKTLRENDVKIAPVVDEKNKFLRTLNLTKRRSNIGIDAVIMAGGLGTRLRPLTNNLPKPLINIGDKPILHHIISDLIAYGVNKIFITTNYLAEKIEEFIQKENYEVEIVLIKERIKMGTIGSISMIRDLFQSEDVIVTNGDLLADINFEEMLNTHNSRKSLITVASIKYEHQVPFAVLDTSGTVIKSFREKPTISLDVNGGVYIINRKLIDKIPNDKFYNATDSLEYALKDESACLFNHEGTWLDIGTHDQLEKARRIWKSI